MDFAVLSHKHTSPNASCLGLNEPRDGKGNGSANLKHQRSGLAEDNHNINNNSWRLSKMPRPGEVDFSSKKASESFSSPFERSNLWPPPDDDDGQKMLSFSSDEPHGGDGGGSSRSIAFSTCADDQYLSNTGELKKTTNLLGSGGGGIRQKGPFTPSQWMELEHQALIYKHIMANVAVPSNLLLPLKRSIYSYGSRGPYASHLLGWGPFHLGYSGCNDPEPGRCRRTDGKKWRCSRDAVPDQKYCERHINRGRHRSRKPVEGHKNTVGHVNSNANVSSSSSKLPPIPSNNAPSSSPSGPMMSTTNASSNNNNSISAIQHQFCSFQQQQSDSTNNLVSRSQGFQGLSLLPPTIGLKPKNSPPFSIEKQHMTTFQESSSSSPHSEFGIVSSDSLLNPSQGIISSYMSTNTSDSFIQFNLKETTNHQHSVHHFIDNWPKESEELKSDWTQLSMSIPTMAAPDSPAQPKAISSLRLLSQEIDPFHISLGVSSDLINEPIQKQPAWLPVTWGNPVGGPLGEVLSAQLGSSPTGVLQKSTFVSFSNSSSVSSPTSGDNNRKSDLLVSSAATPSL